MESGKFYTLKLIKKSFPDAFPLRKAEGVGRAKYRVS
jgi:hypothetical protein